MKHILHVLREDHTNMAKLLDALERQVAVFDEAGIPDYDVIRGVVDYCLTYPDLHHHPIENLVYERLRTRDPAAVETIGDLEKEHQRLGELTRQVATVLSNVLQEAEMPREKLHELIHKFLDAYRHHIILEERDFFRAAERALTPEDWGAIEAQITEAEDPLFGATSQGRFAALRKEILAWDRMSQQA